MLQSEKKSLAAALFSATLLLALSAAYLKGTPLFRPAAAAAFLLALAPIVAVGIYNSRKKLVLASKIPVFLHDLGRAAKAGMPHSRAVAALSAKDYGALNTELSQMRREMSDGRSFEHTLRDLADRLEGTHSHHVLHNLSSGGDFHAAGTHLRELEAIDYMRSLKFRVYALSLYALFFIFAVVATLMEKAYPTSGMQPYLSLIWIQAVFTGIAAGKLAENSFLSGAKHALLLLIIGTLPYIALSGL